MKLLLIDGAKTVLGIWKFKCMARNWEVECINTPKEVVKTLLAKKYDYVLIDREVSHTPGKEILAAIKTSLNGNKPILVGHSSDSNYWLKSGVDFIIMKNDLVGFERIVRTDWNTKNAVIEEKAKEYEATHQ